MDKPLNNLAKQIFDNAVSKGFYDDGKANNIGERIALIHSEVSEALEADRIGKHLGSSTADGPDGETRPIIDVVMGWRSCFSTTL